MSIFDLVLLAFAITIGLLFAIGVPIVKTSRQMAAQLDADAELWNSLAEYNTGAYNAQDRLASGETSLVATGYTHLALAVNVRHQIKALMVDSELSEAAYGYARVALPRLDGVIANMRTKVQALHASGAGTPEERVGIENLLVTISS